MNRPTVDPTYITEPDTSKVEGKIISNQMLLMKCNEYEISREVIRKFITLEKVVFR